MAFSVNSSATEGLFEVGISSSLIDDLLKPLYVGIVYSACSACGLHLSTCLWFQRYFTYTWEFLRAWTTLAFLLWTISSGVWGSWGFLITIEMAFVSTEFPLISLTSCQQKNRITTFSISPVFCFSQDAKAGLAPKSFPCWGSRPQNESYTGLSWPKFIAYPKFLITSVLWHLPWMI